MYNFLKKNRLNFSIKIFLCVVEETQGHSHIHSHSSCQWTRSHQILQIHLVQVSQGMVASLEIQLVQRRHHFHTYHFQTYHSHTYYTHLDLLEKTVIQKLYSTINIFCIKPVTPPPPPNNPESIEKRKSKHSIIASIHVNLAHWTFVAFQKLCLYAIYSPRQTPNVFKHI